MRFERQPGYETLAGRWGADEHRAAMADPATAYLIGFDEGGPRGVAILQALGSEHGNVLLKRIAVEGAGQPFLRAVVDWVFAASAAHRLYLHVFEHNARARRVYLKLGFAEEGFLRENHRRPDGTRVSNS